MKIAIALNKLWNWYPIYVASKRFVEKHPIKWKEKAGGPNFLPYPKTGWASWITALDATIIMPSDCIRNDLEAFDVIVVPVFGKAWTYLNWIRKELGNNSKTKIVAFLDIAIDLLHRSDTRMFNHPEILYELDKADIIFSAERVQQKVLEHLLKREIVFLNHPIDVKGLKRFVLKTGESLEEKDRTFYHGPVNKRPLAGVIYHAYTIENDYVLPYLVLKELDYAWALFGIPNQDVMRVMGIWGVRAESEGMSYYQFHQWLSRLHLVVNIHMSYSVNRVWQECQVLGTPCVNIRNTVDLVDEFILNIGRQETFVNMDYANLENSKHSFLEMVGG